MRIVANSAGGRFSRRLKPRNVSIAAQAADLIGREAFSSRRLASLTIENAGDDIVGVMNGQATKQGDGVFVGAEASRLKTRQGEIHFCECAALPAQSQMSTLFGTIDGNNHFFQKARKSSLRSRSVVVGAVQTLRRSEPRERILFFSSGLSVRGRCCSRR